MDKSIIRKVFDSAPPNSINLGLGELQFPMPDYLNDEALKVLLNEKIGYTSNAGLLESRKAIASMYKEREADEVVITNGSEEALFATFKALFSEGDEILLPDPGYSAYKSVAIMLGLVPKYYRLEENRNFALNIDSLYKQITPKTKAILLNTPSNPTGTSFSDIELNCIANCAKLNDLIVISDEIYRELYLRERPHSMSEFYKKTIVISGLSKSHCMTGWRIGWAIGDKEFIKEITVAHQFISTCANYIGQRLVQYSFNENGNKFVRELRANLRINYNIVSETLTNFNLINSNSAPFVFIKVHDDGYKFTKELLSKKVIVIPGIAFSDRLTRWVRISYALPKNDLIEGLKIFNQVVKW